MYSLQTLSPRSYVLQRGCIDLFRGHFPAPEATGSSNPKLNLFRLFQPHTSIHKQTNISQPIPRGSGRLVFRGFWYADLTFQISGLAEAVTSHCLNCTSVGTSTDQGPRVHFLGPCSMLRVLNGLETPLQRWISLDVLAVPQ